MHVCYTSYSAAIDDAKERMKKGQKQAYCAHHGIWEWPDTDCKEQKMTLKEFNVWKRKCRAIGKTYGYHRFKV